ncbi:hypothetical protein ACI65C_008692 [Semiaphis heraclei]
MDALRSAIPRSSCWGRLRGARDDADMTATAAVLRFASRASAVQQCAYVPMRDNAVGVPVCRGHAGPPRGRTGSRIRSGLPSPPSGKCRKTRPPPRFLQPAAEAPRRETRQKELT